jgi:hypothetical protein
MKPELTPRQLNEIRNMDKKLAHRPLAERAAFIRDFLKLKTTEAEITEILTTQPEHQTKLKI